MSVKQAHVIQVIEVFTIRGEGEDYDPIREIVEYWSLNGKLLAEVDSFAPQYFTAHGDGRLTDAGWIARKDVHVIRDKNT